jgi:thiamine-monophosphate kinase
VDEFALIAAIRERLGPPGPRVALGIGDDAAILRPSRRGVVLSTDVAVEGVHFRRDWLSLEDIGFRSYTGALSDLAAMGASPTSGLLSLILPPDLGAARTLAIVDGVAAAGRRYRAPVIGGNVSGGRELSLTFAVVGEVGPRPLSRSGARVGDGVFVTGTVGAAALGWRLLDAGLGEAPEERVFVERWRRPRARFDLASRLGGVATAAIDISDGLLADLGHLAAASGVGATVHVEALPTEPGFADVAPRVRGDAAELALTGGEDYELLFTAPSGRVPRGLATRIGTVHQDLGVGAFEGGAPRAVTHFGHRHVV